MRVTDSGKVPVSGMSSRSSFGRPARLRHSPNSNSFDSFPGRAANMRNAHESKKHTHTRVTGCTINRSSRSTVLRAGYRGTLSAAVDDDVPARLVYNFTYCILMRHACMAYDRIAGGAEHAPTITFEDIEDIEDRPARHRNLL
eukprot:COSAG02_NODE_534_length_20663_cov_20.040945_11_plen_143_part_00